MESDCELREQKLSTTDRTPLQVDETKEAAPDIEGPSNRPTEDDNPLQYLQLEIKPVDK